MDDGRPRNERDANSAGNDHAAGRRDVEAIVSVPPFSLLTFFWALQKKVRLKKIKIINQPNRRKHSVLFTSRRNFDKLARAKEEFK